MCCRVSGTVSVKVGHPKHKWFLGVLPERWRWSGWLATPCKRATEGRGGGKGGRTGSRGVLQFVILWQLARKCSRLFDCGGGGGGLKTKEIRESREALPHGRCWLQAWEIVGTLIAFQSEGGAQIGSRELIHRDNCCQSGPGLDESTRLMGKLGQMGGLMWRVREEWLTGGWPKTDIVRACQGERWREHAS